MTNATLITRDQIEKIQDAAKKISSPFRMLIMNKS